jgi:hypothetical protein
LPAADCAAIIDHCRRRWVTASGLAPGESFEIGTSEYNRKLDAKIAEIKKQCNFK